MYYRDPKCVFVADTMELAHVFVTWLEGQGIPAEVMNEMMIGGFEGLTALVPGKASLRGIEVWVRNPDDAERARKLADEHSARIAAEDAAKAARTGTIEAVCEECGKATTFPASEAGRVEDCPHCGAFMDVPDPDDDTPNSEE